MADKKPNQKEGKGSNFKDLSGEAAAKITVTGKLDIADEDDVGKFTLETSIDEGSDTKSRKDNDSGNNVFDVPPLVLEGKGNSESVNTDSALMPDMVTDVSGGDLTGRAAFNSEENSTSYVEPGYIEPDYFEEGIPGAAAEGAANFRSVHFAGELQTIFQAFDEGKSISSAELIDEFVSGISQLIPDAPLGVLIKRLKGKQDSSWVRKNADEFVGRNNQRALRRM